MKKEYKIVLTESEIREIVINHLRNEKMVIPDECDVEWKNDNGGDGTLRDASFHSLEFITVSFTHEEMEDYVESLVEKPETTGEDDAPWTTEEDGPNCDSCPADLPIT